MTMRKDGESDADYIRFLENDTDGLKKHLVELQQALEIAKTALAKIRLARGDAQHIALLSLEEIEKLEGGE